MRGKLLLNITDALIQLALGPPPLPRPTHRALRVCPLRPTSRPSLPRCHAGAGTGPLGSLTRTLQQSVLLACAAWLAPPSPPCTPPTSPSLLTRTALLAPLYGVSRLEIEMDEAVLLFPCGMLPVYCLSKICLGKCFGCLWSETATRLSASFGSGKWLVAPAADDGPRKARNGGAPGFGRGRRADRFNDLSNTNGLSDFDGLSMEEDAVRQVAGYHPARHLSLACISPCISMRPTYPTPAVPRPPRKEAKGSQAPAARSLRGMPGRVSGGCQGEMQGRVIASHLAHGVRLLSRAT